MEKLKVGLVLGGGGARGLAHIGLLKVFEANNIQIDVITGTSMGGLIGAVYAQNPDAGLVEKKVREFINSEQFIKAGKYYFRHKSKFEPEDLLQQLTREIKKRVVINLAANRKSLMKGERLTLAVNQLVSDGKIEDTKIPFACAATDLRYGESVVFREGDLRHAITASAAIPGFIPPLEHNGKVLVDGSVCNNFPIEAARSLGANFFIVSNVSLHLDPAIELENLIDIVIRSNSVSTHHINQLLLKNVDYIISPEMGNIHWSEFEKFDALVEMGIKEAEKKVDELKAIIKRENSILGRAKNSIKQKIETWLN